MYSKLKYNVGKFNKIKVIYIRPEANRSNYGQVKGKTEDRTRECCIILG